MATKAKIGVLGASGYTGSELVRLLLRHPRAEIALLTADRRAGQEMRSVFPQFSPFELPTLVSIDEVDWKSAGLDLIFCALPHATTQKVISQIFAVKPDAKVVDLSADFRLRDTAAEATRAYVLHPALKSAKVRRLPEHGLAEAVALAAALPELDVQGSEVVRLSRVHPDALHDLVVNAWRFVTANKRKPSARVKRTN